MKFAGILVFLMSIVSFDAFAADPETPQNPLQYDLRGSIPSCGSQIVCSNNQVSVDVIAAKFKYAEFLDPNRFSYAPGVFDSEKSFLPGLSAGYSLMSDYVLDHLYFYGRYSWVHKKTDYWSAPTQGNSIADQKDYDFRVGKGFDLLPNVMLTPYLGAGVHDWHRDLTPLGPGGYKEEYSHIYVGAGLLLQWSPFERFVLSANGLVGSTFDADIKITFPGYDPIKLGLGHSTVWMGGVSADYAITQQLHVNAGFDYTSFNYGASEILAGVIYEPRSKTSFGTLKAGIGYAF